jgi:hypothetical protein
MAIDAKDRVKLMHYCFNYLQHDDPEVSSDAFNVFLKSTDPDILKAAKSLSPDKLRLWLQNEKTLPQRLRLYAFLLANCGNQQDAALLRKLLDTLVKEKAPPLIDGIFSAYAILDPNAGWGYARELLKNPETNFTVRYSVLRAARYFHTTQPEVVPEKEIISALSDAMEQDDIADIPIIYLRQWKCWKLTDQIIALTSKKRFDIPIIQRAILRYAHLCPDEQAAKYVAEMRKAHPDRVELAEELNRVEAEAAVKP